MWRSQRTADTRASETVRIYIVSSLLAPLAKAQHPALSTSAVSLADKCERQRKLLRGCYLHQQVSAPSQPRNEVALILTLPCSMKS